VYNTARLADTDGGALTFAGEQLPADLAPAVTQLIAAIEVFRARSHTEDTGAELRATLIRLRYAIDLLEVEFSDTAVAFADTDETEWLDSVSAHDWIRHNCRMSGAAVSRAVVVGEQRRRLPRTLEAVVDGRIGFGHAALLASVARAADDSDTAALFDETLLLAHAEAHSVGRFYDDCANARHAVDAAAMLREHVNAVEYRRLELSVCGQGGLRIVGLLDPEGGATLRSALEPLARPAGAQDHRARDRRLADALVELSAHVLDTGVLPEHNGQRPHLQVTTTLETLMSLAGAPAGELEHSTPVPAETVRRLACDASVVRVLLDAESAVIDVGRASRVPPPATRRALHVRDRGCVWPRCDRRATWTVAHHLDHWVAHHGPTDVDNLVLLCYRHHWLVHEGGWQLVRTDGRWVSIAPLDQRVPAARSPG